MTKELARLVSEITRVEVIDDTGRVYTNRPCRIELSIQDGGRTLKVFVTSAEIKLTTKGYTI